MLKRLYESAKRLWLLALRENASPRGVALSVVVGVFTACTPFFGLHMWIAMGLATLFRLNKVWAFVGSRFSIFPMLPLLLFCEIQIGSFVREGRAAPLGWRQAATEWQHWLYDLAIGFTPVAVTCACAMGAIAYGFARLREAKRRRRRAREPSSESPRSGSPDRPT